MEELERSWVCRGVSKPLKNSFAPRFYFSADLIKYTETRRALKDLIRNLMYSGLNLFIPFSRKFDQAKNLRT